MWWQTLREFRTCKILCCVRSASEIDPKKRQFLKDNRFSEPSCFLEESIPTAKMFFVCGPCLHPKVELNCKTIYLCVTRLAWTLVLSETHVLILVSWLSISFSSPSRWAYMQQDFHARLIHHWDHWADNQTRTLGNYSPVCDEWKFVNQKFLSILILIFVPESDCT